MVLTVSLPKPGGGGGHVSTEQKAVETRDKLSSISNLLSRRGPALNANEHTALESSTALRTSTVDHHLQPPAAGGSEPVQNATKRNSLAEAQKVVARLEAARSKTEACSLLSLNGSEDLQVGLVFFAPQLLFSSFNHAFKLQS